MSGGLDWKIKVFPFKTGVRSIGWFTVEKLFHFTEENSNALKKQLRQTSQKIPGYAYSGLSETVLHRLVDMKSWSQVSGAIWGGLGSMALLEESVSQQRF